MTDALRQSIFQFQFSNNLIIHTSNNNTDNNQNNSTPSKKGNIQIVSPKHTALVKIVEELQRGKNSGKILRKKNQKFTQLFLE